MNGSNPIPMMTPIFLSAPEPEKCPHCKRNLEIKTVCRECGGEIEEDESSLGALDVVVIILILVFILWVLITLVMWLFPMGYDPTLLEVLKEQWEWITSKKIF